MRAWLPPWPPPWRFWFGLGLQILGVDVVLTFSPPYTITWADWVGVVVHLFGTGYFLWGYIQWDRMIGRRP
jgi:hypothetical protein